MLRNILALYPLYPILGGLVSLVVLECTGQLGPARA